jgi:hypothetical protein
VYGWDIALALELLVLLFGFMIWFKAARAEGGPKKLAKVVAIVVIILAVLLAACTVTRAFMYAGAGKAGPYGPGYKCFKMMHHGGFEKGKCPCCGAVHGKGHGPGMGMMGTPPCPMMEEPATEEPASEEPKTE